MSLVLRSGAVVTSPLSGGVGWAVAQLSETAPLVPVGTIERDILRHVPAAELFFPAITDDGLPSPLHPLSAYVFTRATLPDPALLSLEKSRYVEQVLRAARGRAARVSDVDLQRSLRVKLREIRIGPGQPVTILAGDWSGLYGRVFEVKEDRVKVYVELRSIATVVTVAVHEIELL